MNDIAKMSIAQKREFIRSEIMTMEDVIATLGFSKQYLYRLKKDGKLVPFISSKGTNIYWTDDVLEYVKTSVSKYKKQLKFIEEMGKDNERGYIDGFNK